MKSKEFVILLKSIVSPGVIITLFLTGCVNPVDGPPPDNTPPVISVYSPLSNDTLHVGETPIYYEAKDDNGISHYEIYINNILTSSYNQPKDSANISIFLKIGTNELLHKINYYVVAYDLSGNKSSSKLMINIFIDKLRQPPAAPANLTLNKISSKIYNLSWTDESDNETNFELWRKEDTSSFKLIRTLPQNSISTNDTIPSPNLPYSYMVKASNENGGSASNIVTTIPDVSVPINPPSNLSGTAYGTSRIKLTWKDNSSDELAFKIERKVSSSNTFEQLAFTNANDTVYYDTTGLFPTTQYTYRIAAVGEYGLSVWSNSISVSTLSHDVNPPDNLQVRYDSTSNNVILSWNDNSYFDIETRIERSGIDKKFAEIGKAGENITTYSDSTAARGNIYYYRIRSYTVDGYFSEYTTEVEIKL